MLSLFNSPPSRRPLVLAVWTTSVVLLIPVIIVAGLLAVLALTAMTVCRRGSAAAPAHRRPTSAVPSVLRLEAAPADARLRVARSRAA